MAKHLLAQPFMRLCSPVPVRQRVRLETVLLVVSQGFAKHPTEHTEFKLTAKHRLGVSFVNRHGGIAVPAESAK